MNPVAIKVDSVSKAFKLPHEKQGSIKGAFVNVFNSSKGYEKQEVLKDISFEIYEGEFFGIVGKNGSGKSTLLKLLAGVYSPDTGAIHINGKLTPFIELGVGFNPELTGRENVYLNGALLGFSRSEMDGLYDEIVSFAELEKFMDQKLKNYSSGMQVRLAFSIAIQAKSDILLLDEVLAVGDAAFQRKCLEYFGNLKRNKQTVVFISHDMESVRKYCDRALLIDDGEIKIGGKTEVVIKNYMNLFIDNTNDKSKKDASKVDLPLGMATTSLIDKKMVKITKVWAENETRKQAQNIKASDSAFYVKFDIEALVDSPDIVPGVIVTNQQGEFLTASNAKWLDQHPKKIKKGQHLTASFKMPNIYEMGDYKISVNVVSEDLSTFYAWKNESHKIHIERLFMTGGKFNPNYEVRFDY